MEHANAPRPHCKKCGRYLDKEPDNAFGWCEACEYWAHLPGVPQSPSPLPVVPPQPWQPLQPVWPIYWWSTSRGGT